MKPFDLEAAKRGEPLITRDGRKAWFAGVLPINVSPEAPVVALADGILWRYTLDGRVGFTTRGTNGLDLFMAPRKFTHWLNVWSEFGNIKSELFSNELDAHLHTNELRADEHILLVEGRPIEWEG